MGVDDGPDRIRSAGPDGPGEPTGGSEPTQPFDPPGHPPPYPPQYPPPYPPQYAPPYSQEYSQEYPPPNPQEYPRYPAQPPPRDGISIAGFVTGLLGIWVVGLALSIAGLVRTGAGRRRGRGFAVAGLLLSVAWAALLGVAVAALLARPTQPASVSIAVVPTPSAATASSPAVPSPAVSSPAVRPSPTRKAAPSASTPPPPVPARKVYVDDLRARDCMLTSRLGDSVLKVPVVPCLQTHDAEVVGVAQLPGRWHGEAYLSRLGDQTCAKLFQRYVGIAADSSEHEVGWFGPTADSWTQGDRLIVCFATDGGAAMTGSLKGAKT